MDLDRMEKARRQGLHYIGKGGRHITGVPAQHMTAGQVLALTDQQLAACLAAGIYRVAPAAQPAAAETEE